MNKWNIFKFHFKKIVWTPYFLVLCIFALLSVGGAIVTSQIIDNKDIIAQNKINEVKDKTYCLKNNTNLNIVNEINKLPQQIYIYKQDNNCKTLSLNLNSNNVFLIKSSKDKEIANSLKASLEQLTLTKHLQQTGYKPPQIQINNSKVNESNFNLPVMFVGMAITVVSFILIMYLITIIFRHIAFERTNKIWDMTLNKIDPLFLFFTKIVSVMFLIGVPLIISILLNWIFIKLHLITIYNKIQLPKLDNMYLVYLIIEFIITLFMYSLISGFVALHVKTVEQIQSMVGWVASLSMISYIIALASVQMPFMTLKYVAFLNPFSTLFSMFDAFYHINNHALLILIPIVLQLVVIIIMRFLIIKKFSKI